MTVSSQATIHRPAVPFRSKCSAQIIWLALAVIWSSEAAYSATAPAAYYTFDETSGTTAVDSSGHSRSATVVGATSMPLT